MRASTNTSGWALMTASVDGSTRTGICPASQMRWKILPAHRATGSDAFQCIRSRIYGLSKGRQAPDHQRFWQLGDEDPDASTVEPQRHPAGQIPAAAYDDL